MLINYWVQLQQILAVCTTGNRCLRCNGLENDLLALAVFGMLKICLVLTKFEVEIDTATWTVKFEIIEFLFIIYTFYVSFISLFDYPVFVRSFTFSFLVISIEYYYNEFMNFIAITHVCFFMVTWLLTYQHVSNTQTRSSCLPNSPCHKTIYYGMCYAIWNMIII